MFSTVLTHTSLGVDIFGSEISLKILDFELHEIGSHRGFVDKNFASHAHTDTVAVPTRAVAAEHATADAAMTLQKKQNKDMLNKLLGTFPDVLH